MAEAPSSKIFNEPNVSINKSTNEASHEHMVSPVADAAPAATSKMDFFFFFVNNM